LKPHAVASLSGRALAIASLPGMTIELLSEVQSQAAAADCDTVSQQGEHAIRNYDVETACSLSTLFRTVGRFIMRSCHAV